MRISNEVIVERIKDVKKEVTGINTRLDKLNGTVQNSKEKINGHIVFHKANEKFNSQRFRWYHLAGIILMVTIGFLTYFK